MFMCINFILYLVNIQILSNLCITKHNLIENETEKIIKLHNLKRVYIVCNDIEL